MSIRKTIVVPVDFGGLSLKALRYASDLGASACGGTVQVLHVVDELAARFLDLPDYAQLGHLQTSLERSAKDQIDRLVSGENETGHATVGAVRTSRSAAEAIVAYARDVDADLIVMGTHGRSAVGRLLLGSVAEQVVRTASCPVLTMRDMTVDAPAQSVMAAASSGHRPLTVTK